jgi:hypothetical protein
MMLVNTVDRCREHDVTGLVIPFEMAAVLNNSGQGRYISLITGALCLVKDILLLWTPAFGCTTVDKPACCLTATHADRSITVLQLGEGREAPGQQRAYGLAMWLLQPYFVLRMFGKTRCSESAKRLGLARARRNMAGVTKDGKILDLDIEQSTGGISFDRQWQHALRLLACRHAQPTICDCNGVAACNNASAAKVQVPRSRCQGPGARECATGITWPSTASDG